jgi:hypothetical protein
MTTLAVDQLITELVQPLSILRDMTVAGVRARLYFHNSPSGTFFFNVYGDGKLLKSLPFTTLLCKQKIQTQNDHFCIDLAIRETFNLSVGEILVKLESSEYSFGESWLGWSKNFNGHSGIMIGDPKDFTEYPFNFKLIEYKEREH